MASDISPRDGIVPIAWNVDVRWALLDSDSGGAYELPPTLSAL